MMMMMMTMMMILVETYMEGEPYTRRAAKFLQTSRRATTTPGGNVGFDGEYHDVDDSGNDDDDDDYGWKGTRWSEKNSITWKKLKTTQ